VSGGFSCGIWYRGSRRIVVLPVPSSFDNERGIYCEMGSGNIALDDDDEEERVIGGR
jgi:hypothetical protein